jgi:Protein of unknown function (DUF3000)
MSNAARPASRAETDAAATFRAAVGSMEASMEQLRRTRAELSFESQPPPRKIAPYAAAVGATLHEPVPRHRPASPAESNAVGGEIGWGSFVLLYDPAGQAGWAGPLRVVVYVRADLEPEIAADPLAGQVGWSWLVEALDARAAGYQRPSGTVTRVVTEGFGAKSDEPVTTGFELRASWSPAARDDLGGDVAAWCDTLCAASGLPPLPDGVRALRTHSRRQRP